MSGEEEKAKVELAVFEEFVKKTGISIIPASICKSGKASEPDIFCSLASGELVAFELVEICSPEIAKKISELQSGGAESLATSDPTASIIQRKLQKTYKTNRPIELLCYAGRTASTDMHIVEAAQNCEGYFSGPFRKVWLLGELGVYEIWSAG